MERTRKIFHKIASASHRVVVAANQYADRRDSNGVPRCHFQLEEDMRRISVACDCLADNLDKPHPEEGPVVDVRIQDWFDTDEPQECLQILSRMERMLQQDTSSWKVRIFRRGRSSAATQDKIKEAADLFNSCKGCFHFLFATEIWNNERVVQKQQDAPHSTSLGELFEPRLLLFVETEITETTIPDVHKLEDGHAKRITEETPDFDVQGFQTPTQVENKNVVPETVLDRERRGVTQKRYEMKTDEQRKEQEKQFEEILKWLDGLNCAEKQDATLLLRQEDTCKWFIDTPQYQTWKDGETGSLWLRGKPGAGKSVLASFVIDSLKKAQREGEILVFFYCDFRNERSTSSAEAMRSILSQLLRQLRSVDLGNISDDLIKAKGWGGGTLSNAKELAGFVSRAAGLLGRRPAVVVDALDECKDVRKLIQALIVIRDHVRLFVTSRPLHIIMDELSDIPFVSMEEMEDRLSADIELHVTRELDARQRLRDLDSGFKMEIRGVLCNKADGMFRWVQCSINTLDRCVTRKEVRKALHGLPKGLDETYERILLAVDVETLAGQLAQRALVWLVAALRPLQLSEIMEALTINLTTRTLDSEIGPMHEGALLDACGSLVTYTERTGIIILSHFSVQEYLMGELTRTELQRYRISLERAHLQLLQSCMCYISICLKRVQRPVSVDVPNPIVIAPVQPRNHLNAKSQPLLDYALDAALDHFRYLGSTFKLTLPDVTALAKDIEQHSWAWDHVCIPARWDHLESSIEAHWPGSRHDLLLYILVAFSPNAFMAAFLRRNALRPKDGTNPLVYAAQFNKDEHARTLLCRGAELNRRGWETGRFRQSLPIEVAFQNRYYAMVIQFVEERSTIPPRIITDAFFKCGQSFGLPSSITRVLLQTDDFAENINDCLNEAAWRAMKTSDQLLVFRDVSEQDLITIIRRFIQVADERSTSNFVKEAFLRFAVSQGYFTATQYLLTLGTLLPSGLLVTLRRLSGRWKTAHMIQYLLDNGVDALARMGSRDSALHSVLWAPGGERYYLVDDADEDDILEAVKLLIDRGCDHLETDSRGNTPLRIAIERGYVSVARYLLSLGSPLPPDLLVTLDRGWLRWSIPPMIHLLVESGADASVRASDGDSLLHMVLQCWSDDVDALETVTFLVDQGSNPLEVDHRGYTPLHLAVERGYISVARYLLTLGARIPPDLLVVLDRNERAWMTSPMIRLLVENGANVLAQTSDGDTVLHTVLRSLYFYDAALDVVQVLVYYGGCDLLLHRNTLLRIAVEKGHISVARYLLTLGDASLPLDLLVTSNRDRPNWWSAHGIRLLVENGIDVFARARDGDTLLRTALQSFDNDSWALEAVNLLVGYGCNPMEADAHGNTPLHVAVERGLVSVARYLLTLGAQLSPDLLVTLNRHGRGWTTRMIQFLVESGANVLAHATDGNSVLHIALQCLTDDDDALEAVRFLVGHGCDPFKADSRGYTPLNIAVEQGHLSAAHYLLTLGARLPLDSLVSSNRRGWWMNANMICFLVENGADVLAHNSDEDPVLNIMVERLYDPNEALEVVKTLVERDCNPSVTDSRGETPLRLAIRRGHISVAQYLLSLGAVLGPDLLVTFRKDDRLQYWGTAPMVRLLAENGVDVCARTCDGDSVLHLALQCSNADKDVLGAVELLVRSGCDPTEANPDGKTPLHFAVQHGHLSASRYLLSLGGPLPPDILVTLDRDLIRWSTAAMILFLVENGVNVFAHASDGDSVPHIAVQCFNADNDILEAVKLLISRGCDPTEANPHGKTLLHFAIERCHISIARHLISLIGPLPADLLATLNRDLSSWSTSPMIRLLVQNGIDVLAHASDGDSMIHVALRCLNDYDDISEAVQLLINYGCDPFEANPCGYTPFYVAVEQGNISAARHLRSLGAVVPPDLLVTLNRDRSWWGTAPMIHFLLESGVNLLACASNGDSVLHIVLQCLNTDNDILEAIKLLITHGCDMLKANLCGETPLRLAVERGHISVSRYLLSLGASLPPNLLVTLNRGRSLWSTTPMIRFLVENGVDVLARASDGESVLQIALRCFNDHEDILNAVKLLISYGCDPLEVNLRGHTSLHVAVEESVVEATRYLYGLGISLPPDLLITLNRDRAWWGTVPMIRFLVEHGVNVLVRASDGDSVLHIALRCLCTDNDLECAKILVGRGCNPLESNSRGETPLHIAALGGYVSAAQYLLDQGASVLESALNGDTVLHFATRTDSPYPFDNNDDRTLEVVKFFVSRGCEPSVLNNDGNTPLHNAVRLGRVKTIKYLLSLNIPLPADILFVAIESDNNPAYSRYIIETLVTSGCDTRTSNSEGVTPLQAAIKKGKIGVVEYLLSVVSVHDSPVEDLLSAVELTPPSVRNEMKRLISDRCTKPLGPLHSA